MLSASCLTCGRARLRSFSRSWRLALTVAVIAAALNAQTGVSAAGGRHAALVVDANTGAVLHAEAADEARYPASLTKMMTLYIVFEEIEQGRLTNASRIKISQEAAFAAPTKLDLEPGEDIALGDALKALVVKSANDIAIAVAEHVSGSEAKFALRMNATALRLGMKNTVFKNASGLPDPAQTTTARDMVTLALRLGDDFPRHYALFSTRTFQHAGNTYRSHNTMLASFEGTDGIKTGYTRMSGFNLVSSVRRGDKRVVGAVFGGSSAGTRNAAMRQLLTLALLKAATTKTRKSAPILVARPKPAPKPDNKAVAVATPVPPAPATTVVATAAPLPPSIEIARVRPVMVAPRVRPATFAAASAEAAPPSPVAAERTLEADPRPAELSPAAEEQPARISPEDMQHIAALSGSESSSRLASWAAAALAEPAAGWSPPSPLRTDIPTPARPSALPAIAPPAVLASGGQIASTARPMALGRSPSSFEQQIAAAIDTAAADAPTTPAPQVALPAPEMSGGRGEALPPAPRHAAPTRREPAASAQQTAPSQIAPAAAISSAQAAAHQGGGFQVQIGAFSTPAEAARNLSSTRERAPDLLNRHAPVTLPVVKENRQLYRARFAGFDARTAASTCLELRTKQIDCFVMKAE